jgi:nucleolar protein 4
VRFVSLEQKFCEPQKFSGLNMGPHRKKRKLSDGSPKGHEQVREGQKATKTPEEKDQRRSLFVRSLPASVTTERLAEHFSQSFPVKHATVVLDPATKISKGYGFVTFTDADDAHAAAEQLNNTNIDGRKIKVEVAESRHRDTEDGGKKGVNVTAERLRAERDGQKQDSQPPRLIVRNLPWSIKEGDDLAKLFLRYGKIKHAVVPKRNPRMQYGFGIVVIRGKKNAERALAEVNGKEVDGRVLAVDWAVDKKTWEQIQQEESQRQENKVSAPVSVDNSDDKLEGSDAAEEDRVAVFRLSDNASESEGALQHASQSEDELDDPVEDDDSSASDEAERSNQNDTTVFVRNLPYDIDDELLKQHFSNLGPVRYARVVYDHETERSRGTGFVCFFNESDAKDCVKNAPKKESVNPSGMDKKRRGEGVAHSVLQNDAEDPTGKYTLAGRVLQVSRALSKTDADRRADEASDKRLKRDGDKRRLYLLGEGTISKSSKLYEQLGKAEIDIRESSARQRQKLIKTNPNLCLSLTRLSIRNLPRHVNSKDLKALARDGIVGFSKDVKTGIRQPLTKEETKRGGDEMKDAEKRRREKGVGVVKQAKIVFEGREGGKVKEGAGRSRGYGFIEYYTHRNALAGLRWLNGHLVKAKDGSGENAKRLIVEFAIENAQVVQRRTDREKQLLEQGHKKREQLGEEGVGSKQRGKKRKRSVEEKSEAAVPIPDSDEKNRNAKRNRIISKKRMARKTRKG